MFKLIIKSVLLIYLLDLFNAFFKQNTIYGIDKQVSPKFSEVGLHQIICHHVQFSISDNRLTVDL